MHELSIAMNILDLAAEESARWGGTRVLGVHLKLGPLSGVVKEALLSAYNLARETGDLAEAELIIEEVPLVIHCQACKTDQRAVSVQELACVQCGSPSFEVVTGRELEIVALEIQ